MNNKDIPYTLGDYFDVIRRRWIYLATILPAAVLTATYIAYVLPPAYRSAGVLLLEPSSIPESMVPTTVASYAGQHIDLVQRKLMTTANLTKLVDKIDPYPGEDLTNSEKAELIAGNTQTERVDPVTLEPLPDSTAFSMQYFNPNPDIAVAVARELVEMFLDFNRESRAARATDNYKFLLAQSKEVNEQILALEKKLADFQARYGDAMPEAQRRNAEDQNRTQRDLDGFEGQIRLAEEKKTLLELQRSQINPNLFDPAGDWRTELAAMRAQLAVARQRYSEDHPTVRRLTRSIEAMSARAGVDAAADKKAPDNPEYIQVASQVDAVKAELAALHASADRARQQLEQQRRSSKMAPEVERQYAQVSREYEGARQRLAEIQKSLDTAALAQTLETEQRGESFTLIRSPTRPTRPASPNRLGILLLGVILGGAVAVGLAALRESSDPTIRSARDLLEFTDIKPLGSVPFLATARDRRLRVIGWTSASIVFAVAVIFVGATVAQASSW